MRQDQQILAAPFPVLAIGADLNPPTENKNRGFPRILVFLQLGTFQQRDDGLSQGMFMSAENCSGGATVARIECFAKFCTSYGGE